MKHAVRWLRAHPTACDRAIAVIVAVLGLGAHVGAHRFHDAAHPVSGPSVLGVLFVLGSSLPLVWRRRSPGLVLCVVATSQCALEVLNAAGPGWMGVLIAAFTFGANHSGRRTYWIAGIFFAALGVFVVTGAITGEAPWGAAISTMLVVPAVVVFGDAVRMRRRRIADLAERAERAERERELLARQHVQEERTRIARELHDVVAHSVSVMVIQAAAARRQLDANPERAAAAMAAIEATGRDAMAEMRRILGVLRDEHASGALAPAPSLHQLDELVRADPDLPVQLRVDGDLGGVPTGVEVSAYRVVQEALTNVRRHAGPVTSVRVDVVRAEDRLDVQVTDDGRGASALRVVADEGGHGLVGMRERVLSAGGQLVTGPRVGGGWRVHAVFPLGAASSGLQEMAIA